MEPTSKQLLMKTLFTIFTILILCFSLKTFAQSEQTLFTLIESKKLQQLKIKAKQSRFYQQVAIDEEMILHNDLVEYNAENSSLVIKESGFYEIFGSFHFSPNTKQLDIQRAGINFMFSKLANGKLEILASKRQVFYRENSMFFTNVELAPTIVKLEAGDVLIICVSSGLLDKDLFHAKIETTDNTPYSYKFQMIKRTIKDE